MKYLPLFLLLILALGAPAARAQTVPIVTQEQLIQRLQANRDSLLVVNFWATWCKPCVKEMPYFTRFGQEFQGQGVKVLLVSNDLTQHLETMVKPFIRKNQLTNEVVLVSQLNANAMIERINELAKADWSGAIPATLLVDRQGQFVAFHEGEFTYESLVAFVQPHVAQAATR